MNLMDLIDQLQNIVQEFPEMAECDVMVATQPSYPLAAFIDCLSLIDAEDDDAEEDEEDVSRGLPTLWIATSEVGSHSPVSPYAPRAAWEGR
jgi:hypothetical protein